MDLQSFFLRIGNPFMKLILRSPLHGMMSKSTLLITVTGQKSGKAYTTPVNYLRQGELISIVSLRSRSWWRNLRGGAAVTLRLQGKDVQGWGTVIEDEQGVAQALADFTRQEPQYARYLGVSSGGSDHFRAENFVKAAETRVIVQVSLEKAGSP